MHRHYADDGFEFDRLLLLGAVYRGLADAGEVLVTLDRVASGDHEAWVTEFAALGDRLQQQAEASAKAGHQVSARSAWLRACTYYATASTSAPGTTQPDRFHTLWEQHRRCWDEAAERFEPQVEPIRIPYEGTTLEGYFFHARSAHGHVRRRARRSPR